MPKVKLDLDEPLNVPKTSFMSNHGNYYYNVIPFSLKNVGATYQYLMDNKLEVYIDDMIVKSVKGHCHSGKKYPERVTRLE